MFMQSNFKKNKVLLACAAALTFASTSADAGILLGKVTGPEQKQLFKGAQINITELGIRTTTDERGQYRFSDLPAGEYTLEVTYLGEQPTNYRIRVPETGIEQKNLVISSAKTIENLVVYAQKTGQASALNMQKNAASIKSIVSSDAIGQFPDQNVSEALQRLPGLFIERDQGEGRFVGIRGIDPNLNNVTINGLNVPSPEAGVRSVALDVIPSQLVGSLEVSKSVTPDMDASAIGGSIEVKSLSGFDRPDGSMSATVALSNNRLRDETSPKLEASYSKIFDDSLALAAAVSYSERKFGSDNLESNGDDELEQRFYDITRERLGAAVNLDFRPDFNNSYYIRTLFSEFSDDEFRLSNTFVFADETEIERASKDRKETQQIMSLTAGAEHIVDTWTLEYQLGYSKSKEENPNALYYTLVAEELDFSSDMQGKTPAIEQSDEVSDFANYELDEISDESEKAEDEETSLSLDLSKKLDIQGQLVELKFGGKYRQREKTAMANIKIFGGEFDNFDLLALQGGQPNWSIGQFGSALKRAELKNMFADNFADLELEENDSNAESAGASYLVEEDIFAAYAMASFDIEQLHVVAGVRYEKTEFSTHGQKVEVVAIEDELNDIDSEEVITTDWASENDYDKFLPSVNLRYEFNENLIARAAYTQTLARPKFEDAAAFQIIDSSSERDEDTGELVTEREAEVGNPNLKPYFSDNFDLTLEYYPGNIGMFSAGYFYKNIDNFIIIADVAGRDGWQDYDEVFQPINGDSAELHGLELAWVKSFQSGLLLAANATITDSEATTFLDGETFTTQLPNQSDETANLTIGYESEQFSIRLTGVYKSQNLEEIDGDMLRYEDDHTQIDLSAKYYINQQMHVYFNGVNLNDEPLYHYFDQSNVNAQYETYGRTFELGFSWTSF
ncbi:TonB-dependent receptor [Gayadomonas joobiniege]|uniref:TonB-dependent receptor n=1 Tax=Gayadomonas joobiniege TaxID=1234606 RepID=UPI00037E2D42